MSAEGEVQHTKVPFGDETPFNGTENDFLLNDCGSIRVCAGLQSNVAPWTEAAIGDDSQFWSSERSILVDYMSQKQCITIRKLTD